MGRQDQTQAGVGGVVKIFCLWNDHHRTLLEGFFLPSFLEFNDGDLDLERVKIPEPCGSVRFGTECFKNMTTEKAKAVFEIVRRESEPFVLSDVDIQFFGPIKDEMHRALEDGKDVVFQKESDIHGVNTGFMLIRPGQKTKDFWGLVVARLIAESNERINDQHITNRLLGRGMIDYGVFGPRIWAYSQGEPPKDMLVHHANCTVGLEAKVRQLKRIKRVVRA